MAITKRECYKVAFVSQTIVDTAKCKVVCFFVLYHHNWHVKNIPPFDRASKHILAPDVERELVICSSLFVNYY